MPALDYVSIIRSVYGDRQALLAGLFASALTAGLTAVRTQSILLYIITVSLVAFGILRYFDMRAFWRAGIDNDDAEAAEHWENRAIFWGTLVAIAHGMWCFVSMVIVKDPFAELASASVAIAAMVGLVARNFGLDRLVTIQMLGVIVPLSLGYALHGDVHHLILAALLAVMLTSFRKLAGDIRAILLAAVHGRVEASRLATELDMAMATMQHGLVMLDEAGTITLANERAMRIFALLDTTSLIGRPLYGLLTEMDDDGRLPHTAVERLLDIVARRVSGKVLLSLPQRRSYEVTISARRSHCVLLFEDISERIEADERIAFMARHDALTGLPNRTYFNRLVNDDLAMRETAPERRMVALMIIDVDDFKHVNDTLGHMLGDKLLAAIARRLRDAVPPDALLAHLGGDEFIVYRPRIETPGDGAATAEAIHAALRTPFDLEGMALTANVSIGLVTGGERAEALDSLMSRADLALYTAKNDGKAKSQIFHRQMDIDYHYRQRLKTDLRDTVRRGALDLAFQPLVDLASRHIVTCEALIRWEHPQLGNIPPATFIPIAEEIGLISEITDWVLTNATRQCSFWPGNVGVAVNISGRDFRTGDLKAMVERALTRSNLSPGRLEIEVTETAVIEQRDTAQAVLEDLAEQGITIALDDFGTGYSSLSYLDALPFTKLKIDRSFVANVADDERALKLLASVARLGRDLDLTVIAEGVETEEQLAIITAHTAIEQGQGYYFSRPLPGRDIAELIGRLNATSPDTAKRRHG